MATKAYGGEQGGTSRNGISSGKKIDAGLSAYRSPAN